VSWKKYLPSAEVTQLISTVVVALATVASAVFAWQLSKLSKDEWLAKVPTITIVGGTNVLGDLGYFGATFVNTTSNAATGAKTYIAAFSCDKGKGQLNFPGEYLYENFFSGSYDEKVKKDPITISSASGLPSSYIYFDQSQVRDVQNDTKDIYFVSKVTFKDSFNNEHTVQYCGKMNKLMDIPLRVPASLDTCDLFNCTDKDCDGKPAKSPQPQICAPFTAATNVNDLLHSKKVPTKPVK
jgi:hypothetical protein